MTASPAYWAILQLLPPWLWGSCQVCFQLNDHVPLNQAGAADHANWVRTDVIDMD